ncbi:hypothetical protein K466DRAFT_448549, partial [Polyporus arcularius HHB13444]
MSVPCPHCGALHWLAEKLADSPVSRPEFGICCNSGKVRLPRLPDPPLPIRNLFTGMDRQSKEFRANIRTYNTTFAFTSLGADVDKKLNTGHAPWVFRIHGELYHRISSFRHRPAELPKYSQLYIYDPRMALEVRAHQNPELRRDTLRLLQDTLMASHRYAPIFRFAFEWLSEQERAAGDGQDLSIRLVVDRSRDRRRYNLPTADDIAVLLPGQSGGDCRDIVLRTRAGPLHHIHEAHPAYAPLHYPILFPYGTSGWHWEMRLCDPHDPGHRELEQSLTQTRYYAYQLQVRRDEFSTILRGGRLFQQYAVDVWAASEQERLNYLRLHQNQLRASLYSGLEDALRGGQDVELDQLGRLIVLPLSFTGSPRHMQQLFQDSMAIARYFKRVDLFLTMTANP